jgi:hypothetical protein
MYTNNDIMSGIISAVKLPDRFIFINNISQKLAKQYLVHTSKLR